MFKKILIPTDGSAISKNAAQHAIDLAKFCNAQLLVIAVAEPYPVIPLAESAVVVDPTPYENATKEYAEHCVADVKKLAEHAKVVCKSQIAQCFDPYEAILEWAKSEACDLIVMGSHGHGGLGSLLLGSQTQKVLAHSKIPVLVYR